MKKTLIALLVFVSPVALAETVLFDPQYGRAFVGQKFNARDAVQVLYEDRPCKLPIVNSRHMREYTTTATAGGSQGCWGRTLGGGIIIIFEDGYTMSTDENAFVKATVDKSGGATVIKSIYTPKNNPNLTTPPVYIR